MTEVEKALLASLIKMDKDVNGFVLGGDDEQTISARAWATSMTGDDFWRAFIDRFFGQGHCRGAWEHETEQLAGVSK